MNHGIDFFRDEVRNGFYIPTIIKQAWASSLDVLAEVDRICQKYNITYYADWGTFLGAVRHGGFIPWDDDLDICMKRDDYIRFRQVADKELPKHYTIHDYERKEDHWLFLSRVVGNTTICYEEEYLNSHYNFPWLSSVDIFIKDYLYEDDEAERTRDKEVMFLITLADGIREGAFNPKTISHHLYEVKNKYHISLPDIGRVRELCIALYRLAEREMSKVKSKDTDKIGQIFPWILKGRKGELKKKYEKIIMLPFEDTEIPVPAYYHEVLSTRYGINYCEIIKAGAAHDYPFFEGQKADLEKVNGAPIPDYMFDKKMLIRPEFDRSNSLKAIAVECLEELKKLFGDIERKMSETVSLLENNQIQVELEKLLAESQQLAVDLGILIEQIKGEDRQCTKDAVEALEAYCEAIYNYYQAIVGDRCNEESVELGEALNRVDEAIANNILNRKEILFISLGPKEWKGMEPVYKKLCENTDDTDIYVVPLPLMPKDILGQVHMSDKEIQDAVHLSEYPNDISYSDWQTYDVSQHCPEIIYIQNPYDERNPYLTIPPTYYAKSLRQYTENLTFIPFKATGEFGEKDTSDMYHLKHYVTAPGVICADNVIVQSENIRKHYIDVLTKFAGEETRSIWERKVTCEGFPKKETEKKSAIKRVIYCIGANELSEHENVFIESVKKRLAIFHEYSEKIKVDITFYPDNREQWDIINPQISSELFGMIEKEAACGKYGIVQLIPKEADDLASEYDIYYGDVSPLIPAFSIQQKNVLIANYNY